MRKSHLRQQVDNYCGQNHTGSYRARMHRHYILHKMIRDLFHLGCVPPRWYAVTYEHIQRLVIYWQKEKLHPSTIMKYMVVIRDFFQKIEHPLTEINNQNLGLKNPKRHTRKIPFPMEIFEQLSNPFARLLLELQVHFGLTLSEAMRLCPDIHTQKNMLLLTREIATNSRDRMIPIRTDKQLEVLERFRTLGNGNSLIIAYGYHSLRYSYKTELHAKGLDSSKSYRYLYARLMRQKLNKTLTPYLIKRTLMRELGLHSRRTLWAYLNE